MTLHSSPSTFGFEPYLAAHQRKDVLRFIACGSVDDGKSTLIGRLLHDCRQLFDDQLAALQKDSRKHGTQGRSLDFALLVDGLAAEREQGITIDVAYRFFSTERRSFIVADTPGHEQYTRNMATGASTADLAILLVDARKGLTRQTRRHSLLVSMLGIRQVVLAVNKMDLVGWSKDAFDQVMAEFATFADPLGFASVTGIPLSALNGDNVVAPAVSAAWYAGPTLLEQLECAPVGEAPATSPFRMGVQWVTRPNSDFRGYAGLIAGGAVSLGQRVAVLPSGVESTVSRIVTADGDLASAISGQSVTIQLANPVDVSRGDLLGAVEEPARVSDRLASRLFWMGNDALRPGATVLIKLDTATAGATVAAVQRRVDADDGREQPAVELLPNEIGEVLLALDRPLAFDPYAENRHTGGFILIDRETADTLALGLVLDKP